MIKNRLSLEPKNIIIENYENYLEYVKGQKESIIEKILSKYLTILNN